MKTVNEWLEDLKAGRLEERFEDIYIDGPMARTQGGRYEAALKRYEELFGTGPVSVFSTPGRSEVGGNHTDHQRGEVLAASVNLDAIAVAGPDEGKRIRIVSDGYPMITIFTDDLERKPEEEGTSTALIRGMAAGLKEYGYETKGFQAYLTSDVLIGAGLSSSAAFETLIGTVISGLFFEQSVDPVRIAQAARYAENVYFGKPCGLMDQMACSVGGLIHIDFADSANPSVERVEVDFSSYGYSLCIVDTKGSHADLTGEYAAIPAEMKAVAAYFGKEALRDVPEEDVYRDIPKLREKLGDRPVLRAIHFYEENRRVGRQVEALRKGDFPGFLELIRRSGNSSFQYLQNVYSNQGVQNQSMSVGLAVSEHVLGGHGVSRVHGGGFAGTLQAFVEDGFVEEYRKAMDTLFGAGACHVLKVRKFGGISV